MKAKIGSVEVEGTPEEIGALLRSLRLGAISASSIGSIDEEGKFVSEEVAFRALKRRPLSEEQRALLSLVSKNHPNWTSAKDIQKVIKYNPNQLAGLLGAFGKRVNGTDGYRFGTAFFDQEWNYELDCYHYRLPAGVLEAVQRAVS